MLKITLVLGILAVVAASKLPTNENTKVVLQVLTPEEMVDFLRKNPQAQPLNREVSKEARLIGQTRDVLTYTLGANVNGDELVAYGFGDNSWPTPQDVALTIDYPTSGAGGIISKVLVQIEQTGNLGNAYIVQGGLGYRYITAVFEAKNTLVFNFGFNIFATLG